MRRALFFIATFMIASGLSATFLTPLSMGDMVTHSDIIVVGKCTGGTSKWEAGNLFTYTNIAVQEVLKGKPGANVTVVLPGGVDYSGPVPIGQDYEGASVIQPGEEVFLFLQEIDGIPNGYAIVGFSQGKFSIRKQKDDAIVFRDLDGIFFPNEKSWKPAGTLSEPLPQFKKEVRQLLKIAGTSKSTSGRTK